MQIKTAMRNDYGTPEVNTVTPPNADEDAGTLDGSFAGVGGKIHSCPVRRFEMSCRTKHTATT